MKKKIMTVEEKIAYFKANPPPPVPERVWGSVSKIILNAANEYYKNKKSLE